MLNKLTNIRIDSACNSPSIKEHKSLLVFDFSLDIPSHQAEIHENTIKIIFSNTPLNMPEGQYKVLDGIISSVEIRQEKEDIVTYIYLDFPSFFEVKTIKGIPSQFEVYIDRSPLIEVLKGRKIAINPGFSKKAKSPTGLLMHIPMMGIAKKLNFLLSNCGAESKITWEKDPKEKNLKEPDCEILIDLYTEASSKGESGFKVYYETQNSTSFELAKCVNRTMEGKLQLPNLGIFEKRFRYKNSIIPLGVVPATENVRIDDAHLRDIDYREKVAQAIFNGIVKFYS
ncbi:N-acetylmuramoyl-L-alanine amidase [Thermoanaerobacter thermohydrosulfuricus]|nr:N-acetylmuramoyl-L-alanine amidase [Thermoanaerobacter thermohydrosulfuricus]